MGKYRHPMYKKYLWVRLNQKDNQKMSIKFGKQKSKKEANLTFLQIIWKFLVVNYGGKYNHNRGGPKRGNDIKGKQLSNLNKYRTTKKQRDHLIRII